MRFVRIILITFIITVNASSQDLRIEKIEPPNWWSGMQLDTLQLMVYGEDLKNITAEFKPGGIKILSIENAASSLYSFINIHIPQDLEAGNYSLVIRKNGRKKEIVFPVYQREKGIRHQGFSNRDIIYLILPDRFADGDQFNNNKKGFIDSLNRKNPDGRHGGDIKGIIDNLDYFNKLGITALWLTPLVENNTPMSYHGYAATDFYNIDPRLGSNKLYREMVEKAHEKGIKIIIDHVANHFHKNHRWMTTLPFNDWIHGTVENHLPANHNKMVFSDPYKDSMSVKKVSEGWFTNYMVDFNQANKYVGNYIIQNTIWWIEYAGLDGVREDTYPYADQKFLAEWASVIMKEYPSLNIVGEVWTGEPAFLSAFQTGNTARGFDSNLPAVTDFGIRDRFYDFLTGKGNIFNFYETLTKDYLYPDPGNLVTFIDNHDVARGLFYSGNNLKKMKIALTLLLTTRGIPQLFYGTETTYPGGEPHGLLRFDFPGGFKGDSVNYFTGAGLSKEQLDYFNFVKTLLLLRKTNAALSGGRLIHYPPENGKYVFFRISDDAEFMVVVNEKEEKQILQLENYRKFLENKKLRNIFDDSVFSAENLELEGLSSAVFKIEK